DVYGEDPSVHRLETLAARLMGKEAAMYVPTGTMGNLCAHLTHTTPGQEYICGLHSHTYVAEVAGASRIAGLSVRTIPQQGAELDPALVEAAIRPPDVHYPVTGLIWVEQPSRGYVMSMENLAEISAIASRYNLPIHMDGARIFNAATYLGAPPSAIAAHVDSVSFCVSKGLAAPVGSLVAGTAAFIERARPARKILGGSMRQAGVIAAAGSYSLERSIGRLQEDHDNARRLAAGLRRLPGIRVDRDEVQTNIFFVDVVGDQVTGREFVEGLRARGVLVNPPRAASRTVRFVTHAGITTDDIDAALSAAEDVLAGAVQERAKYEAVVS
ncbi:MAG: threonine aldolase family protein, partial [Dehalococcoidia bacterium]